MRSIAFACSTDGLSTSKSTGISNKSTNRFRLANPILDLNEVDLMTCPKQSRLRADLALPYTLGSHVTLYASEKLRRQTSCTINRGVLVSMTSSHKKLSATQNRQFSSCKLHVFSIRKETQIPIQRAQGPSPCPFLYVANFPQILSCIESPESQTLP